MIAETEPYRPPQPGFFTSPRQIPGGPGFPDYCAAGGAGGPAQPGFSNCRQFP